ncbi:MAG: T9SS type A sorting domain-containing protein, partial [Flavobacteriales bacterium]
GTLTAPFATTSATTSGIVALSSAQLGLRYGGVYNVRVDANYQLVNGAGVVEPTIVVLGSSSSSNCSNVLIEQQPLVEVMATQVCPAALNRTSYLSAAASVAGQDVCSATSFTFELTRVSDCGGSTVVGLPFFVNSASTAPIINLAAAFPTVQSSVGYWKVCVRPNFSYGNGSFGSAKVIQVNNSAASGMMIEPEFTPAVRTEQSELVSAIYPNPNAGDMVTLQLGEPSVSGVQIRVMDAVGKVVLDRVFGNEAGQFIDLSFEETLTNGVYHVEVIGSQGRAVHRMVVAH